MSGEHHGEPLRVLCFLADLECGGAQRTMVNLVNALPRERVAATLAVARAGGWARRWIADGIPVVEFGAGRTLGALLPLRRRIAASRPAVLFSTMVDANTVAALAALGVRHGPALVLRESNSHRARDDLSALRRAGAGWAYRRADRVVALSDGVRRELIADYGLDDARCLTLHNPVDVAAARAWASAARASPPPWGRWAGGEPVLIGCGRLVRQKGFELLIEALARVGGTHLVILGEGPERARLERLAAGLGLAQRVRMPGAVDDPTLWFAHADLFVLSSRWEGFGHVIVEAMASGLPVLATDCPHGPRDIVTDGVDGVLVPANDSVALAEGIARLVADREMRRRLAGAALVSAERFAAPRVADAYAQLLVDAAERRGCGAARPGSRHILNEGP